MNRYVAILITALLLVSCGQSEQGDSGTQANGLSGKVRLDGSSTVFPISEAVAEEFNSVAPRVRVTVGVSGTGGGFKKFIAGETDINDASRAVKESEIARLEEAGTEYIELPVAFDGLSVVLHPKNDWVDYLTVDELHRIWMPDSTVTKWSDVREGWPDEVMRLYGPGTDSGTFDYFTQAVNGEEQASRPDFTASEDDNVLVQGIAGDRYALGYFGYAYYAENRDKIRVAAIDGGNGPIEPSIETINNGTYAPLSRPIFIYVRSSSLDDPAVAAFVDFYIRNAGTLAEEVGYIALPDETYAAALERVAKRESGTAYSGSNPVGTLIPETP